MKKESAAQIDGYNYITKKVELNGFSLTDAVYPSRLRQPRHTHETPHISFIYQGGCTERDLKKGWDCRTYSLFFHPFGFAHSLAFDNTETRILTIEVKPRWLDFINENPTALNRPLHFYGGLPVCLATRLYGEYRRGAAASLLAMEGIVLEIIAAADENAVSLNYQSARWLNRARDFLHAEFAKNPTIDEIARIAGVHPAHLVRAFRRQTGCTVGEYVRRLRVEFASRELILGDASLGEIAAAAGFSDQSHFSRTFKSYLGLTPGEYRKIMRLQR